MDTEIGGNVKGGGGVDMSKGCCATGSGQNGMTMILSCSGGSNVGQLANQAAVELTKEGYGKMFCLAGIGGHLSGFVQSAKDVGKLVVLDGCEIGCSKAILDHLEIPMTAYIVLTKELGIEKNKNFDLKPEEIEKVKAVAKKAGEMTKVESGATENMCCA